MLVATCNVKDKSKDWERLATSFKNQELSQEELAAEINKGHAFCAQHKDRRGQDNFIAAGFIALDFDKAGLAGLVEVMADPLIAEYHAIFYFTASSTPEEPRFRVIFELQYPISDGGYFRQVVEAFLWRFGSTVDRFCSDPCRLFYGSYGSNPVHTGKVLPSAVQAQITSQYRDHKESEKQAAAIAEQARRKAFVKISGNGAEAGKGKRKYLLKVLDTHSNLIRTAPKGEQHNTIKMSARVMGGYLAGEPDYIEEQEVLTSFENAYRTFSDLDLKQTENVARWGLDNGRAKPLYVSEFTSDSEEEEQEEQEQEPEQEQKADPETGEVIEPGPEPAQKVKKPKKAKKEKSQATLLVEGAAGEYFHDSARRAFVSVEVYGHIETWPVRSKEFKLILGHSYYEAHGKTVPGAQAVEDALKALEAIAIFEGGQENIFTRWGTDAAGAVYLDLANDSWQAVKIDPQGWQVVDRPPVKFRRNKGMLAIPCPVPGGSLSDLAKYVNVEPADLLLLTAWLIGAAKPTGPYPGLAFTGEQGSAKSGASRILKTLLDPASAPIRTAPKEEHDLVIAAVNSWALAYDNLSSVPVWLSDGLCRLATGGGFATRELYTDDQETIFEVCRPVILNGIEALATRSDLLDRYIVLDLPTIPEPARRTEKDVMISFEAGRPALLGALLTAISQALRDQDTLILTSLPRMADFAVWAAAGLGPELGAQFLLDYERKRKHNNSQAIESSLIAQMLIKFYNQYSPQVWEGTPTDLLTDLTKLLNSEQGENAHFKVKGWPQDATRLTGAIKRIAPNLRREGIEIEFARYKTGRRITISRGLFGDAG
jgi:hypothetical protein